MTGTSTGPYEAWAEVRVRRAVPGASCATDPYADQGDRVLGSSAGRSFDLAGTVTFDEVGSWLVCAWIEPSFSDETDDGALTSAVVSVRPPSLGLRVTGAARVQVGHAARYRFRYFAEVPRKLEWDVVRGTRCGHSDAQARPLVYWAQEGSFDAAGSGTEAVTAEFDRRGRYRICGFLQRDYDDGQAQLVAWRSVRVGYPRRRPRRGWE